ncbi:MAG TPA: sulfatase-like hydrolase/transferase [Candidatus Pelethosoma merdigallinarum]|nr:sulfatase-like hydrolase/transferase [Candidatus Pelethosoma merdigallinarum]
MTKKRNKRNRRNKLSFVFLFLALLLIFSAKWYSSAFSEVSLEQLIFHLKVPLEGSNDDFVMQYITYMIQHCIFILIPLVAFWIFQSSWFKHSFSLHGKIRVRSKEYPFHFQIHDSTKGVFLLNSLLLIGSLFYVGRTLHVGEYIYNSINVSQLYETYYVDPEEVQFTFPEQKRNLIYIFLESMESTSASASGINLEQENLIPGLEQLALENINFSQNDGLGGAQSLYGTTWTAAGMVSQTAGITLTVPIDGNTMNEYSSYLPGAYSLGDLLEREGYSQYLMVGSNAEFGGRANYFTQHGNYEIYDYNSAIEERKIDEDYFVWWGFEDTKLFEYAKEKLLKIAHDDSEEPFNFTLLTADTHATSGYVDSSCETPTSNHYANSIICSDQKVTEFIRWIQQQDFYENTTIVICGDHLIMGNYFFPADYPQERSIYNAFINSAISTDETHSKNRTFTVFDMYPTTLASLGVTIEGDRLGLGTNLFSDQKTLPEELGLKEFENQLKKKSNYYNNQLLYAKK